MKFIIILISAIIINISSLDINLVRGAYKEAAQNEAKVEDFYKLLEKITKKDDVTLVAYKGAAIALLGRQEKKVKDKKKLFMEGVSYVEYAIEKSPNNIEVHFVRLGIQENTPKLLNYKDNIEEDKQIILEQFKYINSSNLKHFIKDYILQSKAFSDEEKTVISDL